MTFLKKIYLEGYLTTQPHYVKKKGLPYMKAFRALDNMVAACIGVDLDHTTVNISTNLRRNTLH